MVSSYSSNYLRLLSYTKLLTSHVNEGRHEKALSLFRHIRATLPLDPVVFPLVLKSCAALCRRFLGAAIHAHVHKLNFIPNPFVACALVDMYGKCVSVSHAHQLFDEVPVRNIVVWNSMISLYTHAGNVPAALELFRVMDILPNVATFNCIIAGLLDTEDGFSKAIGIYRKMQRMALKPTLITVLALLRASVGIAALNLTKEIHGFSIRNDIDPHPQLRSGLVEAYGRCGFLGNARSVFWSMREKDVVAWSSLISAYALHGEARIALEIFDQMEMANIKPDGITFLVVLKACSHAGLADEANMYFSRMKDHYCVEATSDHYACLVDILSRAGKLYEAYDVIKKMPVKVTAKAWGALLTACRTHGEVELAEVAAKALFEIESDNPANFVALGRIYASKGRYEEEQKLRREMKERGVRTSPGSSWVVHQDSTCHP